MRQRQLSADRAGRSDSSPVSHHQKEENIMRRIQIVTVFALILAALIFAYSQVPRPSPQRGEATTLRRIQVNARTITALPNGKKYVVDLTKRGVKYEFDPKAGQIDFSRVMVRTARGEVTIGSFLEKVLPKDKMPALKDTSLSFIIGTRATGTVQTLPTHPLNLVHCPGDEPGGCYCTGESDCQALLDSRLCPGSFICVRRPDHPVYCQCDY
jgi:hypothetical protein